MNELLQFTDIPKTENTIMILGWREWADAGSISSGLPQYLIDTTHARKIGQISSDGFYIFQIPGTHHLVRPRIRLEDGYRQEIEEPRNEFYYTQVGERGVVIFLGDEPHMNVQRYARALFDAVKLLGATYLVGVAGVYGPTPYDKDRQVSCIYSLPRMRAELEDYALNFSNYEGGSSIGSFLVSAAEGENLPFIVLYGFVPAYDFARSAIQPQGIQIENDFKAWYDIMRRLNHMFDLHLDLSELGQRTEEMIQTIDEKIEEMKEENSELDIEGYLKQLNEEFIETPFLPLDDVWEQGLRGLFDDLDE
ncbi:MAG: PAC2 family protein [Anaerolineae bacterium]|nr:PAC2 family protein [Anaerolineae bacterium]